MHKKMAEKEDKACEKTRSKNQTLDIRRLALNNSRAIEVGIFGEIFSDLSTAFNESTSNIGNISISTAPLKTPLTERSTVNDKKKAKNRALARSFIVKGSIKTKKPKKLIFPLFTIKLI